MQNRWAIILSRRSALYRTISAILLLLPALQAYAVDRMNLFTPYDWLIERRSGTSCNPFMILVGCESLFKACSFQADDFSRFCSTNSFRKRADTLQLFQDEQDLLAALKGESCPDPRTLLSQKYNLNDDDGMQGLFVPCGKYHLENYLFSFFYQFRHGVMLELHVPVIDMKLDHVHWEPSCKTSTKTFEAAQMTNLVNQVEQVGNMHLYNWHRRGLGDIALMASWQRWFPQRHPLLDRVLLHTHVGLAFPTGKKEDDSLLWAPSFGDNAGPAILGDVTLELRFCSHFAAGIDVDLQYLFGQSRIRRVKSDWAQTDLVFLSKDCVFQVPGFKQQFTLYAEASDIRDAWSLLLAYQFRKQLDSEIFLGDNRFYAPVANSAQKIMEWTAHNVIAGLRFEPLDRQSNWIPDGEILVKHCFNGERVIGADTITLSLGWRF